MSGTGWAFCHIYCPFKFSIHIFLFICWVNCLLFPFWFIRHLYLTWIPLELHVSLIFLSTLSFHIVYYVFCVSFYFNMSKMIVSPFILFMTPVVSLFTLSTWFTEPRVDKVWAERLEGGLRSCRNYRHAYSLLADMAAVTQLFCWLWCSSHSSSHNIT